MAERCAEGRVTDEGGRREGDPAGRARPGSGRARPRALGALALIALAASLAAACVDPLDLDGAPCPCAAGWHCCPIEDKCLADGETCPIRRNCPLPPSAPTRIELGTTDVAASGPNFLPLPAGGGITLTRGPQGGYHVYIQVRMLGLEPAGFTLTRGLFDPAEPIHDPAHALREQSGSPSLYCDGDADWLLLDEQATYVCPTQTGAAMSERDLVLRLDAADRGGRTLSGEWTIHPSCPPGDDVCLHDDVVGCAASR